MGTLFLFWLAARLIISKADAVDHTTNIKTESLSHSFRDGLFIAILNPKSLFSSRLSSAFLLIQASHINFICKLLALLES